MLLAGRPGHFLGHEINSLIQGQGEVVGHRYRDVQGIAQHVDGGRGHRRVVQRVALVLPQKVVGFYKRRAVGLLGHLGLDQGTDGTDGFGIQCSGVTAFHMMLVAER